MAKRQIRDKKTTRKMWDELLESRQMLRHWCYAGKVPASDLIYSMLKHFPAEWEQWKDRLGKLHEGTCEFCTRHFYGNVKAQRFCDDVCARNNWISRQEDFHGNKRARDTEYRERKREKKQAETGQAAVESGHEPEDPAR